MKSIILILVSFVVVACSGKAVSTHWDGPEKPCANPSMVCPYCHQTWRPIPKTLCKKEQIMLRKELMKFYKLHLRVRHSIVKK